MANILEVYGEHGQSWLDKLPGIVNQWAEKWQFRFIDVMSDSSYNFVSLVEMLSTGETAVFKIGLAQPILTEMRWLKCFDSVVPRIYQSDETQFAFLMERFQPGHSLKLLVKSGDDDSATRIICQTIRDLQSHQHKQIEFKHLSELQNDLSVLRGRFDAKILSKVETLFHELTVDRTNDVLLHGDLHHYNILSNDSSWKVIDPHGYIGDPVFEVGPMIYNPLDCYPTDKSLSEIVARRLSILAEELPFDAKRIKAWTLCMTVLSAAWTFEGHAKVPEFMVRMASVINKIG
ncbi:MAG: aminoglycoside phosphotransferase family protein [Gammaproteobacteria bacterium]